MNAMVWSLIPMWSYQTLPLDTVEAIAWGQKWTLGNYKHPPLSGWIAENISALFGYADWPLFVASQILVIIGLIYVYRIARLYLDERESIVASMLLSLITYYNFSTPEYNVNIIELALWPMTFYYFLSAIRTQKFWDWTLLGLTAGHCMICKYFAGLFLLTLFLYLVLHPQTRRLFLTYGPYLALCCFLLVIAPHFIWLIQHDFLPITYIMERSGGNNTFAWGRYLWNPFKLILSQLPLLIFPAIVAWLITGHPHHKYPLNPLYKEASHEISFCLWVPFLIMIVACFLGIQMRTMWCVPLLFLFGLWILLFQKEPVSIQKFKYFWMTCVAFSLTLGIVFGIVSLVATSTRKHFDAQQWCKIADDYYQSRCHQKIPLVVGSGWFVHTLHHYLPYRPWACAYEDASERLLFANIFEKDTTLFVHYDEKAIYSILKKYEIQSPVDSAILESKARFGKPRMQTIYMAIIPPRKL